MTIKLQRILNALRFKNPGHIFGTIVSTADDRSENLDSMMAWQAVTLVKIAVH